MKTFAITQLHTFEFIYEIEAESEAEALLKLHNESHTPESEEFHSMNDRQDWEIVEIS